MESYIFLCQKIPLPDSTKNIIYFYAKLLIFYLEKKLESLNDDFFTKVHSMMHFDFEKESIGLTNFGLDDDSKDSLFGLLLRVLSLKYHNMNPIQIYDLMESYTGRG